MSEPFVWPTTATPFTVAPVVSPPWAQPPVDPVAFNTAAPVVDPLLAKFGHLDRDAALVEWQKRKETLEAAKSEEMEMRKYVVLRAFPEPQEGTNRLALGNGYDLKGVIKYGYGFGEATNAEIEAVLDAIAKVGNIGPMLADRLVSWTPNFLLTEYRMLEENAASNAPEKDLLTIKALIDKVLVKKDAAPSLEIVEPKSSKKKK